jgi:hypothetical protein
MNKRKRTLARAADSGLKAGDAVRVEWGGTWWPAEVVAVRKDGKVKIHYTGWSSDWDEVVPPGRVRTGPAGPDEVSAPLCAAKGAMDSGAPPADSLQVHLTTTPVTEHTILRVGDAVHADYQGTWWPAEVISLESDGRLRIRYPGWDASWDEIIPRDRLRAPAAGVKQVKVVLDRELSVKGIFAGVQEDFLILTRGKGRKRVLVNRHRVAYFEVSDGPQGRG